MTPTFQIGGKQLRITASLKSALRHLRDADRITSYRDLCQRKMYSWLNYGAL
jgi:hypothetical protein